jgi:hypothetical protein
LSGVVLLTTTTLAALGDGNGGAGGVADGIRDAATTAAETTAETTTTGGAGEPPEAANNEVDRSDCATGSGEASEGVDGNVLNANGAAGGVGCCEDPCDSWASGSCDEGGTDDSYVSVEAASENDTSEPAGCGVIAGGSSTCVGDSIIRGCW